MASFLVYFVFVLLIDLLLTCDGYTNTSLLETQVVYVILKNSGAEAEAYALPYRLEASLDPSELVRLLSEPTLEILEELERTRSHGR